MASQASSKRPTGVSGLASGGQSVESREQQLSQARAQLQASVAELEGRIAEMKDWRSWYRKRPAAFLAGAAVLGALASLALGGTHRRRPRGRWQI